jgi:hypothetical protein
MATQDGETGGWRFEASPGKVSSTTYLKNKLKKAKGLMVWLKWYKW